MSPPSGTIVRLRDHWHAQGLKFNDPLSQNDLTDFTSCTGIHLPADFEEYVLHINGLREWDESLFNFPDFRESSISVVTRSAKNIVIADYLISSAVFVMSVDPASHFGDMLHIDGLSIHAKVKSLFSFFEAYMADPMSLIVGEAP